MAIKPWLRILRLPLAPTAICDALACGAFAWCVAGVDVGELPPAAWWQLALTSLLIYGAGMASNDLADRKVDRLKDPSRPLPSGDLRPWSVTLVVVACAGGAVALGGGPNGFGPAVIAALGCAFLYNFGGRKADAAGPVLLGLTRFSNASIAVWPLVLDHDVAPGILLAPLCVGLYAAGITCLSQTEDGDAPARVSASRYLTVAAFGGAAILVWLFGGLPTLGIAVAFGVCSSTLFGRTPKPGPPKKQVLEMLLGLYWLAAVIAGGAHDGTLGASILVASGALVAAWVLAISSQLMIRALRKQA